MPSRSQRWQLAKFLPATSRPLWHALTPPCLRYARCAQWWQRTKPGPSDLEAHYEEHADYDGLAVQWGIGNSKKSLQDCAQACKDYVPTGNGGWVGGWVDGVVSLWWRYEGGVGEGGMRVHPSVQGLCPHRQQWVGG